MDGFPLFFATSGPTKRREHYVCLLFSQYCVCYFLNISRNPNLRTSPTNQFRDYHAWNRIEKLMPQLWERNPLTLKTFRKTDNLFSNLDYWPKSEFPKTLDLSMDFLRIFHGFPTPPSLNFRGGRGSGRQISRPGSLGRALFGFSWGGRDTFFAFYMFVFTVPIDLHFL